MYKYIIGCLMAAISMVSYAAQQRYDSYEEAKAALEQKCKVTCVILSKEEAVELTQQIQMAIYDEGQAGFQAGLMQGAVMCLKDEEETE